MKRSKKLLILMLALVVLAGAWLLAEYMSGRFSDESAAEEGQAENIDLSAGLYEDITALSWSYGGQTVSLSYDSQTERWVNTADETCPIDGEAVEPLLRAVSSVTATMAIEDGEDLEQYGLDEPQITVMAATADHIVTYEVGNVTITGEYYLKLEDGETVYTETGTLAPAFQVQLDDMLALESPPEDIAQVTGLSVRTEVESYTLAYQPEDGGGWYDGRYDWFLDTEDGYTPLETERAAALYQAVTEIEFLSCETWNAQSLADYGLTAPQGRATVSYTDSEGAEKTFSLEFGDYTGGYVYVRLAGSKMVYLADGAALDSLMYPDWTAMTPLDVCPLDWEGVTGAVAELDGHTYEITKITETVESTGEDGETVQTEDVIYSCNGWVLDTEQVDAWLEELSALQGESLAGTAEGRQPLLTVTFLREDETRPEVSVALWSYDSASCLCVVNGETALFVSRQAIDDLISEAESILVVE